MALVHYPLLNRPDQPTCSVCIANYNGEQLIADCLESVFAQQGAFSIEVIVHDDASTDRSVALLREHYPQVDLLASEVNVGFCVSNNRMVAHARGEYVLLLNNDAALFPDAIATLLATAGAQETPGILSLPQYDWESGNIVDRGCLLDPFYNPVPNLDPARHDVAMVIGACLWVPRAMWIKLGGFPEWMTSVGEDLYLCCQARLRGLTVQVAGSSGYRHHQGASFGGNRVDAGQLSTTYRRRRMSEGNKTSALVICTPGLIVWPLLALHVLVLVFEGLVLACVKRSWRVWAEIYRPTIKHVVRDMSVLRRRRAETQSHRHESSWPYMRGFVLFPRKLWLLLQHGPPLLR